MASGLQVKLHKSYRSVLGLRPLPEKEKGRKSNVKTNVRSTDLQHQDDVNLYIDVEAENELFGEDQEFEDDMDDGLEDLAEEDLDSDQVLALAAEKEARCAALQQQVDSRKQQEEQARKLEQERNEVLQRLRAMQSKRENMESSLVVSLLTGASSLKKGPALRQSLLVGRPGQTKASNLGALVPSTSTAGIPHGLASRPPT